MKWEKVTIFISSTFNDMHGERDYLVKNVFPELRDWCEERKIYLVDVDLRWGVTTEDTENANTVGTCLKNIDKSRPFFLCFLGQRRGWLPDIDEHISLQTEETYPDIKKFAKNKSVTEIEIEHALLSPMERFVKNKITACKPSEHALFFFREDNYTDQLNEGQRCIYTNQCEHNPKEADKKLKEFINEIKKNVEFKVNSYYGTWDKDLTVSELSHMKQNQAKGGLKDFKVNKKGYPKLKEVILKQLKEEIIKEYPDNANIRKTSPLQKELDQQDIFRKINTKGFIERKKSFNELDSYLDSDEKFICVLTAKTGMGKTMLLANYITNLNKRKNLKVYARFSGVSDNSGEQYNIWRSILEEAKIPLPEDKRNIDDWVPNLEKLEENIKKVLENLAKDENTVIIIDGINQLSNGLDMLNWLPRELPENLKIILSFKEDAESQETIANLDKSFTHLKIKGLESDEDKKNIINKYLEQFLKALDDEQINRICKVDGSDNPLFLKILLNELRLFGQFDVLDEQIINFPDNPQEAFKKVLGRLEKEENYTNINSKDITKLVFGLLATSRYGLSEEELIESINIHEEVNNKKKFFEDSLKDAVRFNLRQVKPFMKRSEGKFDFFYDSFKSVAIEKYNKNEVKFNQTLSNYFKGQIDPEGDFSFKGKNIRPFNELPYHLNKSKNTMGLEEILSNYIWIRNKSELNNIFNTINDYDYIDIENEKYHYMKLIKDTLISSSHVLNENIWELPTQLWGRLKDINISKIEKLLGEIDYCNDYPWLKPCHHMNTPEEALKTTLKGHKDYVESVCFSDDGNYVVSGSVDNSIYIWDWNKQRVIKRLKGHTDYVDSVCFSDDGKYVVSGSGDNSVRIWDWKEEKEIKKLKGHTTIVFSVCFSSDGKYVVSGSGDNSVRIWDWKEEREVKKLERHTGTVTSVCFSSDGKYVVSGSGDNSVRIWDWKEEREVKKLEGHTNRVMSVCFSSDGKYVASGSEDNSVCVWDWKKSWRKVKKLEGHRNRVMSVCFSHDDRFIASGSYDNSICIWDWKKQEKIKKLEGHTNLVMSVCFSKDDKYIVSGSYDNSVRVWDWGKSWRKKVKKLEGHRSRVMSVCFSSDDRFIASGSYDNSICIWDWKKQEKIKKMEGHTATVTSVCFSNDGRYVVSGSGDNSVCVWDWKKSWGKKVKKLKGHTATVTSVCFSNDGRYVVSGSGDNSILIWDWKKSCKKKIKKLDGHTGTVTSVCFSHDGMYVVSGSGDNSVCVWDWKKQKLIKKLGGHTGTVTSVCFSRDGRYVVSGSGDNSVCVWDWKKQKLIKKLLGHTNRVMSVCFSNNNEFIVSGSYDNSICVWDWKRAKKIQNPIILINTEEKLYSCVFSNNDYRIVAGGDSGKILIYSVENLFKQRSVFNYYGNNNLDNIAGFGDYSPVQESNGNLKIKIEYDGEFTAGYGSHDQNDDFTATDYWEIDLGDSPYVDVGAKKSDSGNGLLKLFVLKGEKIVAEKTTTDPYGEIIIHYKF
ncbi:MAG: DUF4062 domain-containing protein [Methanobrevibacter sp.]|nr:DUF4062 domain-containing protein [Methanobrevibacter sp.]